MKTSILFPHISINVSNIEKSIAFYKVLFDSEATKIRPGYAKFELQNPKLNFSLNEKPSVENAQNGSLNHFGFQVQSTDDVLLTDIRLRKLGLRTIHEENTVCCYALQDKIWVQDPDGVNWEIFVVHADANVSHDNVEPESVVCCAPSPVQILTA